MKKILLLAVIMIGCATAKAQFPTTDSLERFVNRYIRNSAVEAFQNLRMNTALIGVLRFIDSAYGGQIASISATNDSTFRIITLNHDTLNTKIAGRHWTLQQVLTNGSTLTTNHSITIADSITFASGKVLIDQLRLTGLVTQTDTTTYKPLARDALGNIVGFDRWPGSGSGGGTTIVSDSLNYYNITRFGAVGNGTTDCTNAINAAINAAESTRGVVYIPPGTYLVRSSYRDTAVAYRPKGIRLKSNVTIMGAGPNQSIIKLSAPPAGAVFSIIDPGAPTYTTNCSFWDVILGDTVSNVVLKDFAIDGNKAAQVNIGSNPYHTPQASWPDSSISSGIRFNGGTNNRMYNLAIDSCAGYGVWFWDSKNSLITGSKITTCFNGGIFYLNLADGGRVENSILTNNWCDNIRIKSSNISVHNNEISWAKFNTEESFANFAGVYIEGNPIDITGVKITENYVHDNSSFGVDMWNAADSSNSTYPGGSVLVEGNVISYNSNGGVELAIPNAAIVNNIITNNGANSEDVQDPDFYRPYGINLTFTSSTTKGILISGNIIRDTRGFQTYALGNGPDMDVATQLTFSNNTVSGGTGVFEPGVIDANISTVVGNTYRQGVTEIPVASTISDLTINATVASGIHIRGNNAPLLSFNNTSADVAYLGVATTSGQFFSSSVAQDFCIKHADNTKRMLIGLGTTPSIEITSSDLTFRANISMINPTGTNRSLRLTPTDFGLDDITGLTLAPLTGTNVSTFMGVAPRGTGFTTTNRAGINVFNTDPIADNVNYEIGGLRAAGTQYVLATGATGTATARPLMMAAGWMSDGTTNANQLFLHTNGNVLMNTATDNSSGAKLQVNGDATVTDEAYDATAWNGSLEVPTKNAVRDKIESLGGGSLSGSGTSGQMALWNGTSSFTGNSSILWGTSNGPRISVGTTNTQGVLNLGGNKNLTSSGIQSYFANATYTDITTAASGTGSSYSINYIAGPTIAATNTGVTFPVITTLSVDPPTAGTNATITNAYAIDAGGHVKIQGNTEVGGALLAGAGQYNAVTTITADATLTASVYWVNVNATSGNITITLPAANSVFTGGRGINYMFVRMDNTANTITIQRAGSDTIGGGGGTSFTLTTQDEVKGIQCIANNSWRVY